MLKDTDVAIALGVSVSTIRKWRIQKLGPKYLKIGASIRYRPQDIAEFILSCQKTVNHEQMDFGPPKHLSPPEK